MCPTMAKKLQHVSGDKSLVNPYKKPQILINRLSGIVLNRKRISTKE